MIENSPPHPKQQFKVRGRIKAGLNEGHFYIGNVDFFTDDRTWILGKLEIGAKAVEVTGIVQRNGRRYAKCIKANILNAETVELSGKLERGLLTPYSVDGQDIDVSDDTWIFGTLDYGLDVKVIAKCYIQGELKAKKIVVHYPQGHPLFREPAAAALWK